MLDNRTLDDLVSGFAWSKRDVRVDDWLTMSSPWPTVALSLAYLLVSMWIGPAFMRDRKPYELKGTLMFYNLFQVAANVWLLQAYLRNGWAFEYNWVCQPVDTNPDPNSTGYKMAGVLYFAYMFRFVDFFDTIFFLAKKKFGHVNALQVIHHFLMPMYGWTICRWAPGGQDTFGGMFNALIHSIMYTYYFLAALGPQYQKYLWWKRYLTTLQIIQFVVCLAKDVIIIFGFVECGYPWQMSLVTSGIMTLMLVLFTQFYMRTYVNKKPVKKAD